MEILGDWGTSRLRLFLRKGQETLDQVDAQGIAAAGTTPAETLQRAISPWIARHGEMPLTLCGMVGSRNGLIEVPYISCPVGVSAWAAHSKWLQVQQLRIRIAAGLACRGPLGTADVMRGEETQLYGALAGSSVLRSGRHLAVLPGTHSKWTMLENGVIESFHTFPTGEVFALLRDHSTLARVDLMEEGRDAGFRAGLEACRSDTGLLAHLFRVRTAQLIDGRSRGWALGLLSGLLIAHELRDGLRLFGSPGDVILIGDPALVSLYRQAFAAQQVSTLDFAGDDCAVRGLTLLQDLRAAS